MPSEIALAVNRLHYPVLTLGYGRRAGVWFQGCSIHCPGCLVPDTWTQSPEHFVTVTGVLKVLNRWLPNCDGITISGGEPFDQPAALLALLVELRERCRTSVVDLFIYSGYPFQLLQARYPKILSLSDVIVAGPFVQKLEDERPFVGSANQTIHLLTPLAEQRYRGTSFERGFTIDYKDGAIYMAGVPRRGEMARFEELLKQPQRPH